MNMYYLNIVRKKCTTLAWPKNQNIAKYSIKYKYNIK